MTCVEIEGAPVPLVDWPGRAERGCREALLAVCLFAGWAVMASAQTAPAMTHWVVYSKVKMPDQEVFVFAERNGIRRTPEGHVIVLTETLPRQEFIAILNAEDVTDAKAKSRADEVAKRVATNDRLEFERSLRTSLPDDDRLAFMRVEALANQSVISAANEAENEIDCSGQRIRVLSATTYPKGKPAVHSLGKGDWGAIEPNSTSFALAQIACSSSVG